MGDCDRMRIFLLIGLMLISTCIFADAYTIAKLDYFQPDYHFPLNTNIDFYAAHEYSINNLTTETQHITVCFDIVTCPEYKQWTHQTHTCESFDLIPSGGKNGKHTSKITINYPFKGWCQILAQTEISGGSYSKSQDIKKFYMWS